MSDVWAPLRYGWSHCYWLAIEGVPVVWSEVALGKSLPSGYASESPTLVVEGSARVGCMVDRDSGIGAGYPLSFRLLDLRAGDSGAAIADYMVRPTARTYLTQDEASTAATLHVATTAGLSSPVWVGRERVTYTGSTATTLTGCTRGTAGLPGASIAYPCREDAAVVSGAPASWRGRHVALYAQAIDPTGYTPGSAYLSTAVCIWRGTIDAEPQRSGEGDGWDFQAQSLDRLLARPLSGKWTGAVVDTEWRFQVAQDYVVIHVFRYTAAGAETLDTISFSPLQDAGYATGDWISLSQTHAAIKASFDSASATLARAWLGEMTFVQSMSTYPKTLVDKGDWVPVIEVKADAGSKHVMIIADFFGVHHGKINLSFGGSGITTTESYGIGAAWALSPYYPPESGQPTHTPVLSVRLDEGDPGTLPDAGLVKIGDKTYTYKAHITTTDAAIVQFRNVQPTGSTAPGAIAPGGTAEIIASDTGLLADVVARMLHSSGETSLRGAADDLPGSMGYGLPEALVDDARIAAVLAADWLSQIDLHVSLDDQGLSDSLGGLLRLSGRALCVVDGPDSDARLTAIETAAVASGAAMELRDEHVITYPSRSATQVQVGAPASVDVQLRAGEQEAGSIRTLDAGRVAAEGAESAEYEVPVPARTDQLLMAAAAWSLARLVGDAQASVVELDVVPWLDVRPGDAVDVLLTLPELWDWSAGAPGYVGRARCVGREVSLDTGVQRLRLLVDGQGAVGGALCPSTAVVAVTGGATTPATVDVMREYYEIFAAAMSYSDGLATTMRLLYYEPGGGAESVARYLEISAVADTGTVCRLTVDSYSLPAGGVSTTVGWLTWPESAQDDAWQAQWMHDGDGSRWL